MYSRGRGWEFNPFPSLYESIYQQSKNHAEEDYTTPRPY